MHGLMNVKDENIIYVAEPCSMNRVTRLTEECDSVIYTVDFRILTLCSLVAVYQYLTHMSASALISSLLTYLLTYLLHGAESILRS